MATGGCTQRGGDERVTEELRLIVARGESLAILVSESLNVLMEILPRDAFGFVPHVMFSGALTKVMPKLGLGAFDFLSQKASGSKICVMVLRMVGSSPSVVFMFYSCSCSLFMFLRKSQMTSDSQAFEYSVTDLVRIHVATMS